MFSELRSTAFILKVVVFWLLLHGSVIPLFGGKKSLLYLNWSCFKGSGVTSLQLSSPDNRNRTQLLIFQDNKVRHKHSVGGMQSMNAQQKVVFVLSVSEVIC